MSFSHTEDGYDAVLDYVQEWMLPQTWNHIQEVIFKRCWEGETYQAIGDETGYDDNYVRAIGAQLWRDLSAFTGQKVTKHNFRVVLRQQLANADAKLRKPLSRSPLDRLPHTETIELPQGQVPLGASLYVERPPIESECYGGILQPGALIRIKAAKQMGKTSLMARIVEHGRQRSYRTVTLNLELASSEILADVDRFFRWFCVMVGRELGLENQLEASWDDILGSSYNCTAYFREYLLAKQTQPVVLALDNVDVVFNYPVLARDFFGVLRAWYEGARYGSEESEIWQLLRLVVVYSTEVYIPLNVHQSPFNVGLAVTLPPFNEAQIGELVAKYGLNWSPQQVSKLMTWVGGNPYLVQLTLHCGQSLELDDILIQGTGSMGIYRQHLQQRFWLLQRYPELQGALNPVMQATEPVKMDLATLFKLEGMGLVRLEQGRAVASCELYREYFGTLS